MTLRMLLVCVAALSGAAHAQSSPSASPSAAPATPITMEAVEKGREQYHRTCAQCHGRNMVNSGTTVYDLRKFPTDQHERFVNSVMLGKGNMPSFKGAIDDAALQVLWAYVVTRGGKEL